jgi:plasmid stability protein
MVPGMRTTIRIDEELYRSVRRRAAESGRTIGEIIEDAVRQALQSGSEVPPPPPLATYGRLGAMPGIDLASNADLRAAMDENAARDALR